MSHYSLDNDISVKDSKKLKDKKKTKKVFKYDNSSGYYKSHGGMVRFKGRKSKKHNKGSKSKHNDHDDII